VWIRYARPLEGLSVRPQEHHARPA
jgi:hypothetical protein